jgi:5'-nucleotidase
MKKAFLVLVFFTFYLYRFYTAELTIIHINDTHGRMSADPYISQLLKNISGNVLVLDAGDRIHGQVTTNLSKGSAMVELMNAVGYSAMVAGNHEFNYGYERLIELSDMMNFPLLVANVKTATGEYLFEKYRVFDMDELRVGIFGLITSETAFSSDPRNIVGLIFEDPTTVASEMVQILKDKECDIIIALTHIGIDESSVSIQGSYILAEIDGLDVIIDGHSHTKLDAGLLINNTLIAQTGEYGENIGIVEITQDSRTAWLISIESSDLVPDEQVLTKISELESKYEELTTEIVGYSPFFLDGERQTLRTGETNLSNLVTDSKRWATGADISFINSGGIRASIPAGDITMGHVLTVLPFSNIVVTLELMGAEVLRVLEYGVSLYPAQDGRHIQVSGLSFMIDPMSEPGERVKYVEMSDGKAFDVYQTYTISTVDFLLLRGDDYQEILSNGSSLVYFGSDSEILADYIRTSPTITAEAEGRFSIYTGEANFIKSKLFWNYPNPFNSETTIVFQIGDENVTSVNINIYNIRGQIVKTIEKAVDKSGEYTTIWDGTDDFDQTVSSGIYFYRLKTGMNQSTRKMLYLK